MPPKWTTDDHLDEIGGETRYLRRIGQKPGAERNFTCNANPSRLAVDGSRRSIILEAVRIGVARVSLIVARSFMKIINTIKLFDCPESDGGCIMKRTVRTVFASSGGMAAVSALYSKTLEEQSFCWRAYRPPGYVWTIRN